MQSSDSFLLNAFLAFAAIYIALGLIRIALQWKHIKAIVEANATQKQRLAQMAAKNQDSLSRLEALKQGQEEQQQRQEELFRQSAETQQRWSSILSRLEALAEKQESRTGA
jgi:hypothetical protein